MMRAVPVMAACPDYERGRSNLNAIRTRKPPTLLYIVGVDQLVTILRSRR